MPIGHCEPAICHSHMCLYCTNSFGNALQLQQSCTEPTIYSVKIHIEIEIPSLTCTHNKKKNICASTMAHMFSG